MRICIFTLRKSEMLVFPSYPADNFLVAQIRMRYKRPKSSVRIFLRMSESNMKSLRLVHLIVALAAKIPAMEESEATVIALQTDPGLMADTITMSTVNHQLPIPLMLAVPPPQQTMPGHMGNTFLQVQLTLMLLMVDMRRMLNTISSTWQPWLNINNSSKVLLAQALHHLQVRLHRHHPADRYV